MKNSITKAIIISIVIISGTILSCGSKDKSSHVENKIGKMEVVIPEALKDNPEIVEYIEGMSQVVDEYALLMDNMIEELDGLEGKNWEELKVGEQLKLTKTAAKFAMKAAPVTAKWAELEAKRSFDDAGLSEDELLALETLMERFEIRMQQIEEKNQEYFSGV